MGTLDFLLERFRQHQNRQAIVFEGRGISYGAFLSEIEKAAEFLQRKKIRPGKVVVLESDFSVSALAMFFALIQVGCILVPLSHWQAGREDRISEAEAIIGYGDAGSPEVLFTGVQAKHPYYVELRRRGHPGLVLFSSGSTGEIKGCVHDLKPLLEKFKTPRAPRRIMAFLLFDHIGGINTSFATLSSGGCLILVKDRSPASVAAAIAREKVEVLPVSPTFINLFLLSQAGRGVDLSSLKLITYGTEVMPENTLKRWRENFPQVEAQQTYGLSELGILRSKSVSSDSLWVRVGGEGIETRVVDGLLEIKSTSMMLGYLNGESPWTADGWFQTGDEVEVQGDAYRILGRRSSIINVGGQKVYPSEVVSVLRDLPGVSNLFVAGEPHPLLGSIVVATFTLLAAEDPAEFRSRVRRFSEGRLADFKIPQKIEITEEALHNARFKAARNPKS